MPGRLKRLSIATAVAVCVGAATLPSAANAGPVDDLLGGIQKTVNDTLNSVNGLLNGGSGSGGGGSAAPAPAPTPLAEGGTTEPGITGTNPHGQGEVFDISTDAPILDTVLGDVVVGQSRGEQDENGDYHGNVTIASISGLGIDVSFPTDEGQTQNGPIGPINDLLDSVCTASTVCLELLAVSSSTDDGGSQNSFAVANANLINGTVAAEAVSSEGNISDNGNCQTAEGSSTVADASIAQQLDVEAMSSSSRSRACNDGTREVEENESQVLNIANINPLATLAGCDETAADDPFDLTLVLVTLIDGVCNGDDTNGAQADAPYNVRKAIGLEGLSGLGEILGFSLLDLDGATSESLAEAPGDDGPECPDPTNPDCPPVDECPDPSNPDCPDGPDGPDGECPDPDNPDCPDITVSSGGPGGPDGPSADAPDDTLAFTGADMGVLGAIGIGVMAAGLALMALADRRRRTLSA